MTDKNRLGVGLMVLAMLVFGCQDALSRLLAAHYSIVLVLMLRFWFFAAFVAALALRSEGGLRAAAATKRPWLQILRGVTLIVQLTLLIQGFVLVGLVESHATFACYPLLVAALAGPLLGERVTRRQWIAIAAGALGVLVILRPGSGIFSPAALIVLCAAAVFATYSLLTRLAARSDTPQTSFFYTGIVGAALLTMVGPFYWQTLVGIDWLWMLLLCISGATGHYLLIRVYDLTEASAVQPFAYLQLVFASVLGILVFGETLTWTTVVGVAIVIASGLSTLTSSNRV